ncbi:hypothetical protein BGZ76_005466 [Entomortierella beljakovae]|nr:hypothetical protein BGZ76_005466 [Entomortierella beljakovae]
MSLPNQPPSINKSTKPKRNVSFLSHAVVTAQEALTSTTTTTTIPTSGLGRSSFQPGKRRGYIRKGPVQSDSDADDDDDDGIDEQDEDDGGGLVQKKYYSSNVYGHGNGQDLVIKQASPESQPAKYTLNQVLAPKNAIRPGQNYVRKAPVNSDTESDEEVIEETSSHHDVQRADGDSEHEDEDVGGLIHPLSHTRISGPGQNYVRRAPVNSDTESDEEPLPRSGGKTSYDAMPQLRITNTQTECLNGKDHVQDQRPPGQGQRSRSSSSEPSYLNLPKLLSPMCIDLAGVSAGEFLTPSTRISPPTYSPVGSPKNSQHTTNMGTNIGHQSNSSIDDSAAAANLASSMAIYQQQQQEMMAIMQQQQLQIATMHQQQQTYQLLLLQQQQQYHQQLQAVHLQHSRSPSLNGSVHPNDADNDDDDMPLGDKKLHLSQGAQSPSQLSSQPGTPPLQQPQSAIGATSSTHFSPSIQPAQPSILSLPLSVSHPYSPFQYQHSRQPSATSLYSLHSGANTPHPVLLQSHLQPVVSSPLNPASFSPIVQNQQVQLQYQYQHPQSMLYPQPRLADFIEEEQERIRLDQMHQQQQQQEYINAVGGAQLLTSGFPAGYRQSLGSSSLGQLAHDRGSVNSLHSIGSNSSSNGVAGARPSTPRHSLSPHQQQTLLSISSPVQGHAVPMHQIQGHQPLIHVESKPPPPQTGLVGAISAMEREKKLAKANGTNQLQFQHQQQQQMMMMNVEKERLLQEQRRQVWESDQIYQKQFQAQQPSSYVLPAIPSMPLWSTEDEEDDNRPLGTH